MPKTTKKIVDSAIFKTFFSLDFFLGTVFTFMFVGVFLDDAEDFLSNTAKYNALLGVKVKNVKISQLKLNFDVFWPGKPHYGPDPCMVIFFPLAVMVLRTLPQFR